MRKPLNTKNVSTPRNPPIAHDCRRGRGAPPRPRRHGCRRARAGSRGARSGGPRLGAAAVARRVATRGRRGPPVRATTRRTDAGRQRACEPVPSPPESGASDRVPGPPRLRQTPLHARCRPVFVQRRERGPRLAFRTVVGSRRFLTRLGFITLGAGIWRVWYVVGPVMSRIPRSRPRRRVLLQRAGAPGRRRRGLPEPVRVLRAGRNPAHRIFETARPSAALHHLPRHPGQARALDATGAADLHRAVGYGHRAAHRPPRAASSPATAPGSSPRSSPPCTRPCGSTTRCSGSRRSTAS